MLAPLANRKGLALPEEQGVCIAKPHSLNECKVCLRGTWVDKLWLLSTSAVLSEGSFRWNLHGFFRTSNQLFV